MINNKNSFARCVADSWKPTRRRKSSFEHIQVLFEKFVVLRTRIDLSSVIPSIPSVMEKVTYYEGSYDASHWARCLFSLDDPFSIFHSQYLTHSYEAYLNPTDRRGYRGIVRLVHKADNQSTLNRPYTTTERIGLSLSLLLLSDALNQITPISQTLVLGNNSHAFSPETRLITFGNADEPSILHGHVIGRGDPEAEYVPGVPLGGEEPGKVFQLGAASENTVSVKIRWNEVDASNVSRELRRSLPSLIPFYKDAGLEVDFKPISFSEK